MTRLTLLNSLKNFSGSCGFKCRAITGSLGDEAEEAIANYKIPVAPVKIGHRSAFVRSPRMA